MNKFKHISEYKYMEIPEEIGNLTFFEGKMIRKDIIIIHQQENNHARSLRQRKKEKPCN